MKSEDMPTPTETLMCQRETRCQMVLYLRAKDELTSAMRSNNVNAKNILRILLAKIQNSGKDDDQYNDNAVIAAAKTIIKQNEEAIQSRLNLPNQHDEIYKLKEEIQIIKDLLPRELNGEEIKHILMDYMEQLKGVPNVGAATGFAIGILKSHGLVDGKLVKEIVTNMLAGNS